jgi:DNA-binding transcriptional ArsR family regulator
VFAHRRGRLLTDRVEQLTKLTQYGQVALPGQDGHDPLVPPRRPERPSETVAADLRRRIAAGEWAVDDPMPPVGDLAAHYGVSRSTVTRAMRVLAGEGLVRVVPRWGTFRAGGNS